MTARRQPKSLLDPASSAWDREVTLHPKSGPYTYTHFNRDDLRGQRRSMRVLEQLLERCEREDLPAVTWTVTGHSVSGELSTVNCGDPKRVRAAFLAWVRALGEDVVPVASGEPYREHRYDGQIELAAAAKVPAPGSPHLHVGVGLRARWWPGVDDVSTENC